MRELESLCDRIVRLIDECHKVAHTLIAQRRRTHSRWCWRASDWERISAQLLAAVRDGLRRARQVKRSEISLSMVQIEARCQMVYEACRRCHRFNYERRRAKLPFVCRLTSPAPEQTGWWLDEQGRIHRE